MFSNSLTEYKSMDMLSCYIFDSNIGQLAALFLELNLRLVCKKSNASFKIGKASFSLSCLLRCPDQVTRLINFSSYQSSSWKSLHILCLERICCYVLL